MLTDLYRRLEGKCLQISDFTNSRGFIFEDVEILVSNQTKSKMTTQLVTIKSNQISVSSNLDCDFAQQLEETELRKLNSIFSTIVVLFRDYQAVTIQNGTMIDCISDKEEVLAWKCPA